MSEAHTRDDVNM